MKQHQSDPGSHGAEESLPSVGQYEFDIRAYLDALLDGKYTILLITFSALVLTMLYLMMATPKYSSNALLQFGDNKSQAAVLGEISGVLVTNNSAVEAEMEIIRSRRVLGSAVEQLGLDIVIKPKVFPVIGEALAQRRMKSQGLSAQMPSKWGGRKQHWGDVEIAIESLETDARFIGKKLTLESTGNGKFKLIAPNGSVLLEGQAGIQAVANNSQNKGERSPGRAELSISTLEAEKGAKFHLRKKTLQQSILDLSKALTIKEEGRGSGILRISMADENPEHIANIINVIVSSYLAYNVGEKNREIQHMIEFVQKETSSTTRRLELAEATLVEYLLSLNSAGLGSEISSLINRLSSIESQITDLEIQKVGSQSKYTENHPVTLSITRKTNLLETEKDDIVKRLKLLPEEERVRQAMLREVEAAKQQLILLQSEEQALGAALSSISNNIQVVDHAQISTIPSGPRKWFVIGKAILLGLFLGLVYVIGRRALQTGIEDPGVMENELNIPVCAVIVFSRLQSKLERGRKGRSGKGQENLLARLNTSDPAIEGLRRLSTRIGFFDDKSLNNVINISSPSPGSGVSFISENLAQLLADSGMSVLLIDGNLRGGEMNKTFSVDQAPGLTNYLTGDLELQHLVHNVNDNQGGRVDFVARGTSFENNAELLMSERFEGFVKTSSDAYDMVIIATPPVTAVTDGILVARYADRNFWVVRYGKHSKREILATHKIYQTTGISNVGVIFNGMIVRSRDRYNYSYSLDS